MSYTPPSLSEFNASAPSDDGAEVESNSLQWARDIVAKIGTPLKDFAEAINTAVKNRFDFTPDYSKTAAEIAADVTIVDGKKKPSNVKRYGATGDGVTDDTAAIDIAISASDGELIFDGTNNEIYITTGNLIGADSNIGSIRGIGGPTLKRKGAISGLDNRFILNIYSNKIEVSGLNFDGNGTALAVADPTLYTDLGMNNSVGSGDDLLSTDNLTVVTNCYFFDAPGSNIAGAGMQSAIIYGNKFEIWGDHAVYASGDDGTGSGVGMGADVIVDDNIFFHSGSTSNGAVKFGGNVKRGVVTNSTIDIGDERFLDLHGRTVFSPLDFTISNNVGTCGIFANIYSATSSPQDVDAHFEFANNNMRCSDRAFRLGEASGQDFLGHLNIIGGSYENTSGVFKGFLQIAQIDNANSVTEINLKGVKTQHFGILDGPYPKRLTIGAKCIFDQTYGAWILSTDADDASVKTVKIENSDFLDAASAQGRTDINVNDNSMVYIRNNYYRDSNSACILRDLPEFVLFEGNVLEDTGGVVAVTGVTARSATDGVIIMQDNKCISTAGASAVPRLYEETAASGSVLLSSYDIFAINNFFKDVTGAINCAGGQVTGHGGGAGTFYGVGNYGTGTNTMTNAYPAADRSTFLPVLPMASDYTITNESTDRAHDADTATLNDVSDVLATLLQDLGHGA